MQTMIACRGVDVQLHVLTLVPEGGEWSASCCSHFTLGESDTRTLSVEVFEGLIISLDALAKLEISCHC
jgi:hypothetical protein